MQRLLVIKKITDKMHVIQNRCIIFSSATYIFFDNLEVK